MSGLRPLTRAGRCWLPAVALGLALAAGCGTDFTSCEDTRSCAETDTVGGTSTGGIGATGTGGASSTTSSSSSATTNQGGTAGTGGSAGDSTSGGAGGASGGSSGASGAAGSPACDDACEGETSVCDEASDTCVECLATTNCDEGVCDTDSRACVECLESEHCEAPTGLCDNEHFCVECLANGDCSDSQASFCDAGSCTPCQTNDDCTHLTGTTVCDAGQCVECAVAEETVCGGKSCNPATKTCTETDVGSVGTCAPCVADSECGAGTPSDPERRCVPMEFSGELRASAYCLKRQSAGCERPYLVAITAPSLSGAAEEVYCGIDQQNVTCEAVVDLLRGRTCPGGEDSECGCPRDEDGSCTSPGQGGLCADFDLVDDQCTYQCGGDTRCPEDFTCSDQDPDFCQ